MGKTKALGIAALIILLLLTVGCTGNASDVSGSVETAETKHVLFVTDSVDTVSADYVWSILQSCAKRYSYRLTLAEVQGQADKTSATLNQASEGLYDIVVIDCLASELASEWVLRNAGYYPEVRYLCLDVAQKTDCRFSNVTCVLWDDAAAYYYCGAVAALNCTDDTIAFFAAESGNRAEMDFLAFYAGAEAVDRSVRALYYSMGKASEVAEVKAMAEDAVAKNASVVCLQSGVFSDAAAKTFAQTDTDIYLIGAQTALSEKAEYPNDGVLVRFAFHSDMLLKELFEQCFGGQLKSGDNSMNWFNGALTMENGGAYPGIMGEEQRDLLRTVRRIARKDEIPFMPDPSWTMEERQERIQTAAEIKK